MGPHYLCSLLSVNSLPSEMLCVWKFSSNLCSDCLNGRHKTSEAGGKAKEETRFEKDGATL